MRTVTWGPYTIKGVNCITWILLQSINKRLISWRCHSRHLICWCATFLTSISNTSMFLPITFISPLKIQALWFWNISALAASWLRSTSLRRRTFVLGWTQNSFNSLLTRAPWRCGDDISGTAGSYNSLHLWRSCKEMAIKSKVSFQVLKPFTLIPNNIKFITNRWAWALVPTKLVEPGNALA